MLVSTRDGGAAITAMCRRGRPGVSRWGSSSETRHGQQSATVSKTNSRPDCSTICRLLPAVPAVCCLPCLTIRLVLFQQRQVTGEGHQAFSGIVAGAL